MRQLFGIGDDDAKMAADGYGCICAGQGWGGRVFQVVVRAGSIGDRARGPQNRALKFERYLFRDPVILTHSSEMQVS